MGVFRRRTEKEEEEHGKEEETPMFTVGNEVDFNGKDCPFCKKQLEPKDGKVSFMTMESNVVYISMFMQCSCGCRFQIRYSNPEIISAALPPDGILEAHNEAGTGLDFNELAQGVIDSNEDKK